MDENSVLMEQIANPLIQREFSIRSAQMQNPNVWRYVDKSKQPIVEVKKKVVEPVAVVSPPMTEPSGLMDGLRKQYEDQTGKKADGRWSMKVLAEKIKQKENEI
jgi:hypothetical protein